MSRIWVDPERMVILRHELDAAESAAETYAIAEVTTLEWNRDQPDERFEFEPPARMPSRWPTAS